MIKMGGVASDNLTAAFFEQIAKWQAEGKKIVIVHGGGHYISEMMALLDLNVQIKNGLRVTNAQTLEVTRMVLLGQVQPMITTYFQKAGFHAVGLNAGCDQLICGTTIDYEKLGYVGQVTSINHQLIELMTQKNHIPVIAPLGITSNGQWLNINADEAACKIAAALKAEKLFLLTDVPGIKKGNDWLEEISFDEVEEFIQEKIVTGGMLPKLVSAKKALVTGVKSVCITNTIEHLGTEIHPQKMVSCSY